jgi:hypothetical protein
MKRPASIGGRRLPKAGARCALCGEPWGDPRDASVTLVYACPPQGKAAFRTVCRSREGCQARQRKQG